MPQYAFQSAKALAFAVGGGKNLYWGTIMAVWRPKHENTLNVKLVVTNLYDKMPYGGSVGGFYKRFRQPAAPPAPGFSTKS